MDQRRSSKGRGSIMDLSISILREVLKDDRCDLEELNTMFLNNSLPSELRSIAWRIMLGILPKDKHCFEWVEITKKARENFDKITADEEIENILKVIRKEADRDILPQSELLEDYNRVLEEIVKIPGASQDFFNSESVRETLLTLYIIWKKNNPEVVTKFVQPFHILAGIIYCLYPSILHYAPDFEEIKKKEDVDARTLYYFLNDEKYFDADVYQIFDLILKKQDFRELINNFSDSNSKEINEIKEKILFNENFFPLNEESREEFDKLNRAERINYIYLRIVNENLVKHCVNSGIKLPIYVPSLLTTLLISSISFENLTYFWDNIFAFSDAKNKDSFDFLDFIIVSLLNNLNDELFSTDRENYQEVLFRYPVHKLDSKHILNKALKFKEKINDILN